MAPEPAPTSGTTPASQAATPGEPEELDVRTLAHGSRHDVIFGKLQALAVGEQFVIVNDHDPRPLKYQTEALWPGMFEWEYLESGPAVWRLAISRAS